MIGLALHLGRLDFDAVEQELFARPSWLLKLMAFYQSEGWGEDRADLRTGHQTKTLLEWLREAKGSAAAFGAYLQCDRPTVEQIRERDGRVLESLARRS